MNEDFWEILFRNVLLEIRDEVLDIVKGSSQIFFN